MTATEISGYVLDDVVAVLVKKQRGRVRPEVLRNESDLVGRVGAFNDLLCSPRSVLVNTNHSQMGCNTLQHREPGLRGAFFEELLNDL